MGEIHHADDAEYHRVADGNETVDRTERDAVDELLGEDFHARAPSAEASPTIRQPVKLYQGAARPATAATLHPRALWAEEAGWGERARNRSSARALTARSPDGDENGTLFVTVASWRADPDSAVDLGVRRTSLKRRLRRLAGPMGSVFRPTRAINEEAAGLRPPHYLLPPPMDLGDLIRIFAFALVFAAMALWEMLAPRRALAVGRRPRWA